LRVGSRVNILYITQLLRYGEMLLGLLQKMPEYLTEKCVHHFKVTVLMYTTSFKYLFCKILFYPPLLSRLLQSAGCFPEVYSKTENVIFQTTTLY